MLRSRLVPFVLLALTGAVLAGCHGGGQPDRAAAQAYLDAYAARNAGSAAGHTTDAAAAQQALAGTFRALPGATPRFTVTGVTGRKDASSSVDYSATWSFPATTASWSYRASLPMTKTAAGWQVAWSPAAVVPGLQPGQQLAEKRTAPPRAALDDRSGQPLFTEQPVVTVGVDPAQVTDLPSLAAALAAVPELQTTAAEVTAAVQAAGKDFAPIITVRRDVYDQLRDRIHDLPGTAFQEGTQLLGPTTRFAQPLLGRVGPATAEQVSASKGAVVAGDEAGQGGLQEALNGKLAGTPGLAVTAVDGTGATVSTLATLSQPTPGTAVTLTLDRATQTAADAALGAVTLPAALVVTQPSTGQVLAVANSAGADGDIALTGQYPPGSTFKIVTYTAAFTANPALSPATPAACPATTVVNGQTIQNENRFDKGTVPLSQAFAFSCNTTAAQLALGLPAGALARAAASLGLGQKWTLPVPASSGSMPTDATSNELAAEGYGQGKTLVSPLVMAEIAGGAATGTAVAPSLVMGTAGAKLAAQPPAVTGDLNALMRDVVTVPGATGRDLAELPGPVEGKTGTAEFGTDVPPKSHSWFAGTRGDLAFAVFVYGGEGSTSTAVPIAKAFLQQLPG